MKFKLQHTNLSLSNKSTSLFNLRIIFSFATEYLANAKAMESSLTINPIIDLSKVGSIALTGTNQSYLTVSLGEKSQFNLAKYLTALKALANFLSNSIKIDKVDIILEEQAAKLLKQSFSYYMEQTIFNLINQMYYFDQLKSTKKNLTIQQFNFVTKQDESLAISNAISLLEGVFLVKNLANQPANIATPSYLADIAKAMEELSKKVKVEILDEKELKKLKMNAFLAVAQGSAQEAKFIKLNYSGAKSNQSPIVLIGKGITFDSGGISIKPRNNLNEMKYDMSGAATVMGVFLAVVKLELPINLVVLVPSCENMPSGKAVKPGDIIKTMSGQTVEILNTDAEGRLILCDALEYAKKYQPKLVIDIATLTGACIIALGNAASGLYTNDDNLTKAMLAAAKRTNDKVWQLPLFDEYTEALTSSIADLKNIGDWNGFAGSAVAAAFLAKFTDYTWAHLDIAGTAHIGGFYDGNNANAGATGRPFYLLMDFLRHQTT